MTPRILPGAPIQLGKLQQAGVRFQRPSAQAIPRNRSVFTDDSYNDSCKTVRALCAGVATQLFESGADTRIEENTWTTMRDDMPARQLGDALAALVMLALVGATSCTKPDVTKSKLNDSAIVAPALLRFETVRSILEDSKGNYWFGSWKEGVCRVDGKSF